MSMNFASAITARQYYSTHGQWGIPHPLFQHLVPTGKPTPPDTSALTAAEQATIANWMAYVDLGSPLGPQGLAGDAPKFNSADGSALSGAAVTKIVAYVTYFATAAYLNWRMDNLMSRESQWRWRCADMHDYNSGVVAPTSSSSGSGSGATAAGQGSTTN